VLVHGIGFRQNKIIGYWGRIPKLLQKNGASVYYSTQDAWGSVEHNAEIIKQDVERVLTETGAEKVNLIAHSNGGMESRYMIHELEMAPFVASLTTFCTCHHGLKTVDRLLRLPQFIIKAAAFFVNCFFRILGDKKPDFYGTCQQLTTDYCKYFNEKNINSTEIIYRSYAAKMKNPLSDILLWLPCLVVGFIDGESDGLVSVESAKWGEFMGVTEGTGLRGVSHADAVDCRRYTPKSFDICGVYVDCVKKLAELGL